MFDVALSSAVNFLLALLMARSLPISGFAFFGIVQTIQGLLATGVQSGLTDLLLRAERRSALAAMYRTVPLQAVFLTLAVLNAVLGAVYQLGAIYGALACVVVGMCFWAANRAIIVSFLPRIVAKIQITASAAALMLIATMLLVEPSGQLAWVVYIAVFAFLHAVSVILIWKFCKPGEDLFMPGGRPPVWSLKLGVEGIIVGGSSQALSLFAFGRLGIEFTAAYRVATLILSPLAVLAPLFDILLLPRYARNRGYMVHFVPPLLVVIGGVSAYGIIGYFLLHLAPSLFGEPGFHAQYIFPFVAAMYVFQFGNRFVYIIARALGLDRAVSVSRIAQIAVNAGVAAILISVPAQAPFLVGICASFILGLAVLAISLVRYNNEQS